MRSRRRWAVGGGGFVCLGMIVLATAVVLSSGAISVRADDTGDPALRELAQRYIQRDGSGQTELLPGQLPGDLPLALALPAGSRLVGSVARRVTARNTTWDIFLDSASRPDDVVAFFRESLRATGWATPPPRDPASSYVPSGFQAPVRTAAPTVAPTPRPPAPNAPKTAVLCPATGDPGLSITARAISGGVTNATIHVDAVSAQCASLRRAPSTAAYTPALPALAAPADSDVEPVNYDDVGDNTSDATVGTDMPAADLAELYGKELTAAGWTRITGDARGPLAWSLWSTKDGKQGYLSVLEIAGQGIRDVHVQVDSLSS